MCYTIVDDMHSEMPELLRDQYWDQVSFEIPYTHASLQYQKPPIGNSTDFIESVFAIS